ncbi:hypothetical protein ACH79_43480 [Bradyrhizobium sp. CCBAU 051011]|uniref:oligosaccharide flippase family protein n=1 Tax=Bradyrhizobium sp. CCBAU 051011 TaxID=858422 RepID=UPI001373831D|nr:oligosaccharide flippase family protein [Bradyrhizobium sp. CCBAU 051011]QHO78438.1 hypothetical protein ACH79_43480 [Bradyrhizobium sp. CCBAU 051011]
MSFAETRTLKQRVLAAGSWSLAGYAFSYAFRLGSTLIMTRLLVPEMFGIMAIATMISVGLAMLSDLGLKPSVVQNSRGSDPSFLNTVWLLQICRGLVLAGCLILVAIGVGFAGRLGAIPTGSVYEHPSLPYVIAALSLAVIVNGFESTKTLQASRNLLLARITGLEIVSQIVGFAAMVTWAIVDRSIWALIAGGFASTLTRTVLSHTALPGTSNTPQWNRAACAEIIRFGKWLFLSSALYFVATNGDRILLGAMVDPATLGAYAVAFLMFSSVDQVLTKMVVDVSFPALSEVVRSRPIDLKRSYYRFHLAIASAAYFSAGCLMVSGEKIVSVLYDARYQQAGPALQILSVALLAYPFRIATQTFLALGLAKVYFQLHLIRIVVLFLAVPFGFNFLGFPGAIGGVVLSYFSSVPLTLIYASRAGLVDIKRELLPVPAALLGAVCGWMLKHGIVNFVH